MQTVLRWGRKIKEVLKSRWMTDHQACRATKEFIAKTSYHKSPQRETDIVGSITNKEKKKHVGV